MTQIQKLSRNIAKNYNQCLRALRRPSRPMAPKAKTARLAGSGTVEVLPPEGKGGAQAGVQAAQGAARRLVRSGVVDVE